MTIIKGTNLLQNLHHPQQMSPAISMDISNCKRRYTKISGTDHRAKATEPIRFGRRRRLLNDNLLRW